MSARQAGDRWQVAVDQDECDHCRNYEVQSPGKRRFGLTGLAEDMRFVRVQRVEEEPIERPEPASSNQGEGQ